ncbi:MAG TPA: hypothetical protein ENI08_01205 [Candidatus Dependentiae bacterium]|nr:hypothetical protein [Candidatus Dependentiae bacterium]
MNRIKKICSNIIYIILLLFSGTTKINTIEMPSIFKENTDFIYETHGTFRPEAFFGKNISLLNNDNPTDRIWFARHTLDLNFDMAYGKKTYDHTIAEFLFAIRNKAVWGDPKSIAQTTEAKLKILDSLLGSHRHFIPRHIFWIREIWLNFVLSEALGLHFDNEHRLTIGAFKFELGHGIALGSAFAVGPEVLGFYTDIAIDQYAFGAKLSGDLIPKKLSYDVYSAILQNKSGNFGDTSEKIRGQEFGRLEKPARGFGRINYVLAVRLHWFIFESDRSGILTCEPYALYNRDPEQRVEFLGDALSKLGTFGMACEYEGDRCLFGFEYAFNVGRQKVRGWDRNQIKLENRNGFIVEVNSHAHTQSSSGPKALHDISSEIGNKVQAIINNAQQNESNNGKLIGTVSVPEKEVMIPQQSIDVSAQLVTVSDPDDREVPIPQQTISIEEQTINVIDPAENITLFNAENRFRNPFSNIYKGWMFVADAACWIYKKDFQLAGTIGVASGDDNPNEETKDGDFAGFIGLQELYYGKRVKSAFVLGNAGKLRRPLSVPKSNQAPTRFARVVSRFTNLVFVGGALNWQPRERKKLLTVHPNVLFYWQESPVNKFGPVQENGRIVFRELNERARMFLGTELNIFVDYYILKDLKLFCVGSVFIPGGHYDDIRGKPLDAEQQKRLDRFDTTGFDGDRLPNLGDDVAFTLNLGLEFKF